MVKIKEIVGIEVIIVAIVFGYFLISHNVSFTQNYKYNCFDYGVSNTINISQLPNASVLTIQQNFIFKSQNNDYFWYQYTYDPKTHEFFIETWKNGNAINEKVVYHNLNVNLIHLHSFYTGSEIIVNFNNESFSLNIPKNYTEVSNNNDTYGYYGGNEIEIDSNDNVSFSNFSCNWN